MHRMGCQLVFRHPISHPLYRRSSSLWAPISITVAWMARQYSSRPFCLTVPAYQHSGYCSQVVGTVEHFSTFLTVLSSGAKMMLESSCGETAWDVVKRYPERTEVLNLFRQYFKNDATFDDFIRVKVLLAFSNVFSSKVPVGEAHKGWFRAGIHASRHGPPPTYHTRQHPALHSPLSNRQINANCQTLDRHHRPRFSHLVPHTSDLCRSIRPAPLY